LQGAAQRPCIGGGHRITIGEVAGWVTEASAVAIICEAANLAGLVWDDASWVVQETGTVVRYTWNGASWVADETGHLIADVVRGAADVTEEAGDAVWHGLGTLAGDIGSFFGRRLSAVDPLSALESVCHDASSDVGEVLNGIINQDATLNLGMLDNSLQLRPYSEEHALIFWQVSQATYQGPSPQAIHSNLQARLPGWLVPSDHPTVAYDSSLNVMAFVSTFNDGTVVLAFRGTDFHDIRFRNLQDDLNADQTTVSDCTGCAAHSGILASWRTLESNVVSQLAQHVQSSPSARLVICGHSLGGGLATLAAYYLVVWHGFNAANMDVFTYGAPRTLNNAFARHYLATKSWPSWRMTHWLDPIPHLPFMQMGFHHVGTEIFQSGSCSTYWVGDGTGEDQQCSDQFGPLSGVSLWNVNYHLSYFCGASATSLIERRPPPPPPSPPPSSRDVPTAAGEGGNQAALSANADGHNSTALALSISIPLAMLAVLCLCLGRIWRIRSRNVQVKRQLVGELNHHIDEGKL